MTGIGVVMTRIEITTENYRKQLSQSQSKKISSKKKIADPHGMITDLEEKQYITLFQTSKTPPQPLLAGPNTRTLQDKQN